MLLICTFKVGLLLWVVRSVQILSAADYPPVMEEQNVVLTCSGNSDSIQRRSLGWVTTKPRTEAVNQAICHSTESSCINYNTRYEVNGSFTDKTFFSSLTILAISQHERFMTFNCTLFEMQKSWAYVVGSWRMSNIVYPPKYPMCKHVYNPEDSTLNISCSTPKVFPGIVCKVFEVDGFKKKLLLTTPEYVYKESSFAGYQSVQCSLVTGLSKPGIFKYKVELYPGISGSDLVNINTTNYVHTSEIEVPGNPEVYIKYNAVCDKNNKTLRFLCTSRWLPSPANLLWFKNATLISNTTTNIISVDAGLYTSQSAVELQIGPNIRSIHCQANYMPADSALNKIVSTQLLVDSFVPSFYFTYKGIPLGKHFVLEKGKDLGKFQCVVNGGSPVVNSVIVVCQTHEKVQNFSSVTRSVSFDIPVISPKDTGICFCSASKCLNLKVNFTFSSGYPIHSSSTFLNPLSERFINTIGYIIAVSFVLVCLVFFLATVMALVRRWNQLYTYVYGKFYSQSQTQGPIMDNGGHQQYCVASSTTSDILILNLGGETLISENNVQNHRSSMTSTPNNFHSQHFYCNLDIDSDEEYSL